MGTGRGWMASARLETTLEAPRRSREELLSEAQRSCRLFRRGCRSRRREPAVSPSSSDASFSLSSLKKSTVVSITPLEAVTSPSLRRLRQRASDFLSTFSAFPGANSTTLCHDSQSVAEYNSNSIAILQSPSCTGKQGQGSYPEESRRGYIPYSGDGKPGETHHCSAAGTEVRPQLPCKRKKSDAN